MTEAPLQVGFPLTIAVAVVVVVVLVVAVVPSAVVIPVVVAVVEEVVDDGDGGGGGANAGEGPTVQHQSQQGSPDEHAPTSNENENASDAEGTSAIVVVVRRYPSAEYSELLARVLFRVRDPSLCLPSRLYPPFLAPCAPVYAPSPYRPYTRAPSLHSQRHTIPPPPRLASTAAAANDDAVAASPRPVHHAYASQYAAGADADAAGAANGNDDDPSLHPYLSPSPAHTHHLHGDDGALLDAHVHAADDGDADTAAAAHPEAPDQGPTVAEEGAAVAAAAHTRHDHVEAHDTPHHQVVRKAVAAAAVVGVTQVGEEAQHEDANARAGEDVDGGVLLHAAYAHVR